LVKPGDEVILFEPFFDLYVNQIKLAGGTPVYVPLTFVPYSEDNGEVTGGEWILEPEKLEQAISPKTSAIILNSPHNPTGKVFTLTEMKNISEKVIAAGPQCVVISDEVYKYIVHSPPPQEEMQVALAQDISTLHPFQECGREQSPSLLLEKLFRRRVGKWVGVLLRHT
jgi:aspartate/methionine/tyrosine aminotransferase